MQQLRANGNTTAQISVTNRQNKVPELAAESIPGPFGTLSSSLFAVVLHVVVEVGRHVPEQKAAIVTTAAEECSNNQNHFITSTPC